MDQSAYNKLHKKLWNTHMQLSKTKNSYKSLRDNLNQNSRPCVLRDVGLKWDYPNMEVLNI